MHTGINKDNPHSYNRYGFAWEHIPKATSAHLDFGCYKGSFLNSLRNKEIKELVGVDVNKKAIEQGQEEYPDLNIMSIDNAEYLPFDDQSFDSASILDVIEHVYEQTQLLSELNRILKVNGKLIVTVPRKHLFSFLDMGNWKFRFPRLHKWYYCMKYSEDEYNERYISNPARLIGDVSAKKRWHEHFSRSKLTRLLSESGFEVVEFDGSGYFSRIITNARHFLGRIKPLDKMLAKLQETDVRIFESTNLFCAARKTSRQSDARSHKASPDTRCIRSGQYRFFRYLRQGV